MKKLAATMAIILSMTTAVSATPENLLIGTWKLDPAVSTNATPYCLAPLEFTVSAFTQRDVQGRLSTLQVSYIPAQTKTFPTTVYMLMSGAHSTYVFKSRDRMVLDTWLQCTYVRA